MSRARSMTGVARFLPAFTLGALRFCRSDKIRVRLMVRRDGSPVCAASHETCHDWSDRFPSIVDAPARQRRGVGVLWPAIRVARPTISEMACRAVLYFQSTSDWQLASSRRGRVRSMPSAFSLSITLRRTYSLEVIKCLAAARSMAGGRAAGQRIRTRSVKRAVLSLDGLFGAEPIGLSNRHQAEPRGPNPLRG